MKDLFTLNDDRENGSTETSNLFGQLSEDVNVVAPHANNQDIQASSGAAIVKDENTAKDARKISGTSKKKGKEKIDDSNGEADEETNILRSLFDAQGIHSAVNHDLIMNAHDEDKVKLDEQASQVAHRAAEALRQSRMIRSQESIAVPTWTGKSGAAGAPGSSVVRKFGSTVNSKLISRTRTEEGSSNNEGTKQNNFVAGASGGKALSSSELLAKIRGTQEQAVGDALEHQLGATSSSTGRGRSSHNLGGVQPEILIRQICTFIQQRGGSSDSASIVQHFKDRIPSKDLPVFKSLLKEIATLQRNPNGSSWILKPEYQ